MVATRQMTIEDLERFDAADRRFELIRGEPREDFGVSIGHGALAQGLGGSLWLYSREHRIGLAFASDTRFVLDNAGPTVLRPDASFVRFDRLPGRSQWDRSVPVAPDLAVEVVSPSNSEGEILDKIGLYLRFGTTLVWLVRPMQRTVTVYRPDAPPRVLTIGDRLDGEDLLPGFSMPLSDLFGILDGD